MTEDARGGGAAATREDTIFGGSAIHSTAGVCMMYSSASPDLFLFCHVPVPCVVLPLLFSALLVLCTRDAILLDDLGGAGCSCFLFLVPASQASSSLQHPTSNSRFQCINNNAKCIREVFARPAIVLTSHGLAVASRHLAASRRCGTEVHEGRTNSHNSCRWRMSF